MKKRIYICFIKTLLIFIYLFMKTEKHTTGKILLILSILGLIFLFNTLLFLIDLI